MTFPAAKLERLYVASPIRRYVHQPFITRWFKRALPNGFAPNAILELGCGTGAGLLALHKKFPRAILTGVEIDKKMARTASRRFKYAGLKGDVMNASITQDLFPPNSFNLAVSYGCLHHIPNWEDALKSLVANLSTGGCLAVEEYYKPLLEHPLFSLIGSHPPQRFTHTQLVTAIEAAGLTVLNQKNIFNLCGHIVAQKQG